MSLPSGLNFSIPETADSQTRVFEKQIRPDSGTQFRQTELMRFTIPKGRYGSVIDPEGTYLSFQVQYRSADGTAVAAADRYSKISVSGHPACVFNRMNVFAGSTLLESVRNYGLVHHTTAANTQPMDIGYVHAALSRAEFGGGPFGNIGDDALDRGGTVDAANYPASALYQMKSPLLFKGHILDTSTPNTERVVTPLMSGVIGTTARKHFPISLTSNGLSLELVLGSDNEVLSVENQGDTTLDSGNYSDKTLSAAKIANHSYEILNPVLTVKYLEIPPTTMEALAPGGVASLNTEMYTTLNTSNLVQGLSRATIVIPARYRSLKTLVTVMQNPACYTLSKNTMDFTHNNVKDMGTWQYSLDSELYPLTPCEGMAASYRQLLSAYDMQMYDADNQITPEAWTRLGDGLATLGRATAASNAQGDPLAVPQGRFVMATTLERFRAKSGLLFNGTSSIGSNIHLMIDFDTVSNSEVLVSHIVHYDSIVTISGGECSVSF